MAETKPTPAPAAETPFKFDEKVFKDRLEKQVAYLEPFAGKPGHNPFFQLQEIRVLNIRFDNGERSKELFDLSGKFEQKPPISNQVIKDQVPDRRNIPTSVGPKAPPTGK